MRPEDWPEYEETQLRSRNTGKVLDELDFQLAEFSPLNFFDYDDCEIEVWVELPEMGVVGWAKLEDVVENVSVQPGPGNVVTGTFAHISDDVIDLQIEDQDKPIGCTSNHPFWSVDRQDFVDAGELQEGERVQLYNGETKRVVQKLPRPGPQNVYNLEVYSEHAYRVTLDGVLVHNSSCGESSKPWQLHHFASNKHNSYYTKEFKKALKPLKMGLYGKWNTERMPHSGRHSALYHEYVLNNLTKAVNEAIAQVPGALADKSVLRQRREVFKELFESYVKAPIRNNPKLLYKNDSDEFQRIIDNYFRSLREK